MSKKIKFKLTLTVSGYPDSEEFASMKNDVLSGKMKRDLNEEYTKDGRAMKAHTVTFTEVF